ncbi:hypothetical protein CEXT_360211 [Caerostris extrusa]|uniref:Transmembrane protein n=1 Tax=Caerostris extrusa TaxID=172846 RepID=A0AAV4VWU7_CAEEX|nr:hypothetical protein CEXT_360211 [Caerostris extrusa]
MQDVKEEEQITRRLPRYRKMSNNRRGLFVDYKSKSRSELPSGLYMHRKTSKNRRKLHLIIQFRFCTLEDRGNEKQGTGAKKVFMSCQRTSGITGHERKRILKIVVRCVCAFFFLTASLPF